MSTNIQEANLLKSLTTAEEGNLESTLESSLLDNTEQG